MPSASLTNAILGSVYRGAIDDFHKITKIAQVVSALYNMNLDKQHNKLDFLINYVKNNPVSDISCCLNIPGKDLSNKLVVKYA